MQIIGALPKPQILKEELCEKIIRSDKEECVTIQSCIDVYPPGITKEKEQKFCSKQRNIGKKYRVFITFVMNTRYGLSGVIKVAVEC